MTDNDRAKNDERNHDGVCDIFLHELLFGRRKEVLKAKKALFCDRGDQKFDWKRMLFVSF